MTTPASDRLGTVRLPHSHALALALCLTAFAGLLYATRHLNFFYDDWDFVLDRDRSLQSYLVPHNEHWWTIPFAIYRILLVTVGAGSYLPFMAVLLLLHAGSAFLLYLVVRRGSGDVLGLSAAALLLFLGQGWEDILWAFQMGFLGSVFCGLAALRVLESRSVWSTAAASGLLTAGLMFSGVGLIFCGVVAVELLLDPARRRRLWVLLAPVAAYSIWQLSYGRAVAHTLPLGASDIWVLAQFVATGVGASLAAVAGLGAGWAPAALVLGTMAVAVAWYRRRTLEARALAAAAGLVAQFTITGFVRWQFGAAYAASPRYLYVGAVFALPLLADAARGLPWRGALKPVLAAVVALAVSAGALHLREALITRNAIFAYENSELQTLQVFRDAPDLQPGSRPDPVLMPQVAAGPYYQAVDSFGSPVPATDLDGLRHGRTDGVDTVLRNLFGRRIEVISLGSPPMARPPVCGIDAADIQVPAGGRVLISSQSSSALDVYLWFADKPPAEPTARLRLEPGYDSIRVPDTGHGVVWHVRIGLPAGSQTSVCSP